MIRAKGKLKKKRKQEVAEEQAELEKEVLEKMASTVVRKSSERQTHFPTRELRNVMADTFERVWEEMMPGYPWKSEEHRRINAEDMAIQMIRLVKYGIPEGHGVKISEHEFHPRYCGEHRRGG